MTVVIQEQSIEADSPAPGRMLTVTLNGKRQRVHIEDRQLLVDVLRGNLGLTGTHVGCYNGDCGACTLRIDGRVAKSCLILAASVDGSDIVTIEGFGNGQLDPLQQALWESDAFQCGFCVPGHLFALDDLLNNNPEPTDKEIRDALIGNLCRCTGYMNLVAATHEAAARRRCSAPCDKYERDDSEV
ncbi:(2Fe-2S)-binding protein [Caballeronia sp. LjRoot34]|uniref:(2Fe-2S)-binding protein n=1 Tax=Caballeronia sp. LjRoot34 TaxID=3342325 RepID=UPI003ECE5FB5